jgi:enoyl-[acyl-carrier-protein] reductase (NADH)
MAVGDRRMFNHVEKKRAQAHMGMRWRAAVNLLSDLSSGITGQNYLRECGFCIVGI